MLQPEVQQRILDAAEACRHIQEFTHGMDYSRFAESALVRSAVERQLEIIGDAARQRGDGQRGHFQPWPRASEGWGKAGALGRLDTQRVE